MSFDRPRHPPEFSDIPIRYLYVKVERLSSIREEIEMEGTRWRVIEINYGDNNEFYNANGSMARLTVTPVGHIAAGTPFERLHDFFESSAVTPEDRAAFIRAEVEAMDWPEIIDA